MKTYSKNDLQTLCWALHSSCFDKNISISKHAYRKAIFKLKKSYSNEFEHLHLEAYALVRQPLTGAELAQRFGFHPLTPLEVQRNVDREARHRRTWQWWPIAF